ncbi:MAG: permease [Pseudomonadota bacterium]|nr:permease [Pseudomonadota bacterium]
MLLLHLIVRLVDPRLSAASLDGFAANLSRLLPLLGVMFLLLWLFNLFVKPQQVVRRLGQQSGPRGWMLAVLGGVISMGPMYLWYPMLGELRRQGLRSALAAAFLYSRAVKIPMLPFMVHYFGGLYTGLFVLSILLFSILSGLLLEQIE